MAPRRRPLAALRDDLDSLLEDYLSALDDYQHARTTLQQHLKDGYFDLARAKVALGPTRVGPASYDLAERASERIVLCGQLDRASRCEGGGACYLC
ncbi:hypothetical protein Rhopal_002070-T1 [Rhodotorula paludigena]|uniref:Vacuolar ATPase assembly protein VMA22 n=1 Tax=Rhodotorula paludigena TaxID=86838 RepID=A0AAV5GHY9_9BASI|nr:hypothetical protein Rhopal_002070-T1 [Rhodotorula paludigena]